MIVLTSIFPNLQIYMRDILVIPGQIGDSQPNRVPWAFTFFIGEERILGARLG